MTLTFFRERARLDSQIFETVTQVSISYGLRAVETVRDYSNALTTNVFDFNEREVTIFLYHLQMILIIIIYSEH